MVITRASKALKKSPPTLEGGAFNGVSPISTLVLFRSLNLALAISRAERLTAALFNKLIVFPYGFQGQSVVPDRPLLAVTSQ